MTAPNPLGEAPIRSLFFKYYLPILINLLSVTLHQVINGIILGQQVGKEGLASVGLYGPVVIVFMAISLPIMIGAGIMISKNIGAGEHSKVQHIFQFATTLALLLGGVIAIITPFIIKPVAYYLAGNENIVLVQNFSDYMFWQLLNLPFFFMRMFWSNFLSNDNAPKAGKNASIIAVAVNILLDLLFIIGLGMGVKGASIATSIAIFVANLYLFNYIRKRKGHFGFSNFRFTLRLKEWKQLLNFGLPSFASELSFSFGLLIISHSVVPYGSSAVAAFGLINYISFIFIRLFTAAMLAALPIISFNIGARLPHRVLAIFKFAMAFTLLFGLIITVAGFFIPALLLDIFSSHESLAFRQIVSSAVAFYFILFVAAGPNYILSAYFQSIGKSAISTIINILKGFALIWLFLFLLPGYFKLGLDGVWLSRSLAEVFTFFLIGIYTFYRRKTYYSENAIVQDLLLSKTNTAE